MEIDGAPDFKKSKQSSKEIQHGKPLAAIQTALQEGAPAVSVADEQWKM